MTEERRYSESSMSREVTCDNDLDRPVCYYPRGGECWIPVEQRKCESCEFFDKVQSEKFKVQRGVAENIKSD